MHFADSENFIEIVIYILVMVGGLVANAYRSYTKRKQQREAQANQPEEYERQPHYKTQAYDPMEEPETYHQPRPADTFQEVFRNLLEPELIENSIPEPAETELEEEAVAEATEHDIIEEDKEEPVLLEIEEGQEGLDFDLEKAVLFSEILKPKYIENHY